MGRSRIRKKDLNKLEKESKYREDKLREYNNTDKFKFDEKSNFYGYTLEQIECRVLAKCNQERLKEHRQCDYCHLVFDCRYYEKCVGVTLCKYLDENKGE